MNVNADKHLCVLCRDFHSMGIFLRCMEACIALVTDLSVLYVGALSVYYTSVLLGLHNFMITA